MFWREFTEPVARLIEAQFGLRVDPAWGDAVLAASLLIIVLLSLKGLARLLWRMSAGLVWSVSRAVLRPRVARHFEQGEASETAEDADDGAEIASSAARVDAISEAPQPRLTLAAVAPAPTAFVPSVCAPDAPADAIPVHAPPPAAVPLPSLNDNAEDAPRRPPPRRAPRAKAAEVIEKAVTPAAPEPPPMSAKARKALALAVRDAVLARFAEGSWFRDDLKAPHTYLFRRVSQDGLQVDIVLTDSEHDPARGVYTLNVRIDGRKALNVEWTAGGEARLKYLSAGAWTDTITLWKFAAPRRAAAL